MPSKSSEYERIMALIPGTDPEMLDRWFLVQQISPTTARIWAEQGVLGVCSGEICKLPPPPDPKGRTLVRVGNFENLLIMYGPE